MRRSLILVLTAVGGGASYAAGITEVGRDANVADLSTWRWHVSSILADQKSSSQPLVPAEDSGYFTHRYQRYSPLGSPQRRASP